MNPRARWTAGITAALALTGFGISPSFAENLHRVTRSGLHLYAGDKVAISEEAPGGLFAGAGEVRIEGVHAGDIFAAGGNVTMDHVDTGRVIAAGGHVTISGALHNGVVAAGGDVAISRGATVTNDAILSGGHVVLDADVSGDVIAAGGTVELSGHIAGDAEIRGGKIILHPGTRIDGNLTYAMKAGDLDVPAGVTVGGKVVHEAWDSAQFDKIDRVGDLIGFAGVALAIVVLASLVLLGGVIWLFWYLLSGPRRAPE